MYKKGRLLLISLLAVFMISGSIAFAMTQSNSTKISVASVDAVAGSTVSVDIEIENNPGVLGSILQVSYDEGLTLKNAVSGTAFSSLTLTNPGEFSSPCNFVWDGTELAGSDIKDGVILTLTFDVSDDALPGDKYNIYVSSEEDNIVDTDLNPLSVSFSSGKISVKDSTAIDTTIFTVDSINAQPGSSVDVNITVDNNPGILGAVLTVNYDNGLTLNNATSGSAFSTLTMTAPGTYTSPCNFAWDAVELNNSDIKDGTVLTLTFDIPSNAVQGQEYDIQLSCNEGDIVDANLNSVDAQFVFGKITVQTNSEHNYILIDAIEPDCENAGIYIYECEDCGETYIEEPEALGHDIVVDPAVEPTCTENGMTEGSHCARCNKVFTQQEEVPALGHEIVIDPAVAATCTEDGLTEGSHCSRCNEVLVQQETVYATGHQYEFYRSTVSCERDGYVIYKCSVCGKLNNVKTSAYGHDYSYIGISNGKMNYKCNVCDNEVSYEPDEILVMWDPKYLNTQPIRGDYSQYLEVVQDGIINAKDYAVILKATK